jgi:hypothetical protein
MLRIRQVTTTLCQPASVVAMIVETVFEESASVPVAADQLPTNQYPTDTASAVPPWLQKVYKRLFFYL